MRNPATGGHQVHRARLDPLERAKAVAMIDGPVEKIGYGRQVDVRVRPDVDPVTRPKPRGPQLVEEDEGADHRPLARRQRPVDLGTAEVVSDRRDGLLELLRRAILPPERCRSKEHGPVHSISPRALRYTRRCRSTRDLPVNASLSISSEKWLSPAGL